MTASGTDPYTNSCPGCGATLYGLVTGCSKCGRSVDIAAKHLAAREAPKPASAAERLFTGVFGLLGTTLGITAVGGVLYLIYLGVRYIFMNPGRRPPWLGS